MPPTMFRSFRVLLAGLAFVASLLPANAQDANSDADEVLSAVVRVKSKILPNARSTNRT